MMVEITQTEAEQKIRHAFGTECISEYDPKMNALKCWLYRVSNGRVSGVYGGRTWADALKDAGLKV